MKENKTIWNSVVSNKYHTDNTDLNDSELLNLTKDLRRQLNLLRSSWSD